MRNYNSEPKNNKFDKNSLLKCQIPSCNKKYRTEKKRQQHVEKSHFYETIGRNRFKFDNNIKAQIYELAASYIEELDEIRNCFKNNVYYGESSAKNLLPQLQGTEIDPIDLKRIMTAQVTFAERLLKENLLACDWSSVMNDFECFFQMGLPYYDTNFCPTLPIDFLWHATMQNPDLYIDICKKSTFLVIPHCSNERTEDEDMKRYMYFLDVFQHCFNKLPYQLPSQNIITHSDPIAEIKQTFINLRDKELTEIENLRIQKEERIRRHEEQIRRQIEEEKEEKRRQEEEIRRKKEKREALIKKISKNVNVNLEGLFFGEIEYYLDGYNKGLRTQALKDYVKKKNEKHEKFINSKEYREWAAKC